MTSSYARICQGWYSMMGELPTIKGAGNVRFSVIAPFFVRSKNVWIDDHVRDSTVEFVKLRSPSKNSSWHQRKGQSSPLRDWVYYWRYAQLAVQEQSANGLITVFPQLASTAGLQKRIWGDYRPTIAWSFNLGRCYPGLKQRAARLALQCIDRFVVHSTIEIDTYARWLNKPRDSFTFVPLQRGSLPVQHEEEKDDPFVLSVGSARRDYATFFRAIGKLGYRTVVIASQASVAGLVAPPNVTVLCDLSHAECREYMQKARVCVIPIDNTSTGSGQVTLVEAMVYGRPVVATECIGTRDYIEDTQDGLLVPAGDADALASGIEFLWEDEARRRKLGGHAEQKARTEFSDAAAARALAQIIRETTAG